MGIPVSTAKQQLTEEEKIEKQNDILHNIDYKGYAVFNGKFDFIKASGIRIIEIPCYINVTIPINPKLANARSVKIEQSYAEETSNPIIEFLTLYKWVIPWYYRTLDILIDRDEVVMQRSTNKDITDYLVFNQNQVDFESMNISPSNPYKGIIQVFKYLYVLEMWPTNGAVKILDFKNNVVKDGIVNDDHIIMDYKILCTKSEWANNCFKEYVIINKKTDCRQLL